MGMMGIRGGSSDYRRVTYRNTDGSVTGTVSYNISKKNDKKYKKLRYNFKGISKEILRTKTSLSARAVMIRAKGVTARLRRNQGTGVYDEEELRHAIIHAQRMERIAKKRMKHLLEEENIRRRSGICRGDVVTEKEKEAERQEAAIEQLQYNLEMSREEMQELMEEIQEMLEEMDGMEELEEISGGAVLEMDPEDLDLLKKKHRSDEVRDILAADLKYLKAFFGRLERERQAAATVPVRQVGGYVQSDYRCVYSHADDAGSGSGGQCGTVGGCRRRKCGCSHIGP